MVVNSRYLLPTKPSPLDLALDVGYVADRDDWPAVVSPSGGPITSCSPAGQKVPAWMRV